MNVPSFHDNVFTCLKLDDFPMKCISLRMVFQMEARWMKFMNTNLPFIPLSLSSTSLKCLASIKQFITSGKLDNKWECNLLEFHLSSIVAELHLVYMSSNLGSTLLCNTSDDELFYFFLCFHLVFNNSSLSKMHFPKQCIL